MIIMDLAADYPETKGFNGSDPESLYSLYYSSYSFIYNDTTISSKLDDIMKVLYITLPILLAVIGIIGNTTVMYIIFKHRDMQTVTNYFLANLAATDVAMLTICAIPSAVAIFTEIPLSVCKGINYIMFVCQMPPINNHHHYFVLMFMINVKLMGLFFNAIFSKLYKNCRNLTLIYT